ncbi:MAG: AAA family ATPase [Candidatus Micrarchaeia archaeon]
MAKNFEQILSEESIFKNRNLLSPHYIPETLPHREKEIDFIMRATAPALRGEKPKNLFIYGKTGTGKTSCARWVMEKFNAMGKNALMWYANCRVYNTRYRVLHRLTGDFMQECAKTGYGISFIYEKLLDWVEGAGRQLVVVLDEIDMVKDLDDLVYTLTRSNDDLKQGGVSMIGISNRLSFKERLDPRSRSALYESELVFSPYNATQLASILRQRAEMGIREGCVSEGAINLAASLAARENGDARYALKLLLRAGEVAMERGEKVIRDEHVEAARESVEEDVAVDAIATLPEHQALLLHGIAELTLRGGRYARLGDGAEGVLSSGEAYEGYVGACRQFGREPRSARWFKEYLADLEMLGLVLVKESGKGMRGRTRLISLAYPAHKVKEVVEGILGAHEGA